MDWRSIRVPCDQIVSLASVQRVNARESLSFDAIFVERFGRSSPIFLFSLIALIGSSYFAGLAEARGQRDFLVTKDRLVILRVHGNRAICVPLQRAGESDMTYSLRNLDNIDTPFEWVAFRNVSKPLLNGGRLNTPLLSTNVSLPFDS